MDILVRSDTHWEIHHATLQRGNFSTCEEKLLLSPLFEFLMLSFRAIPNEQYSNLFLDSIVTVSRI